MIALTSCSAGNSNTPANADPSCTNDQAQQVPQTGAREDLILRGIAGASDNIFIARIADKDSTYTGPFGDPVDVYKADVRNTLTGRASGSIHVALGGVKNPDGSVCHYANLALGPGRTYLLATIFNSDRTVYAIRAQPQALSELTEDDLPMVGSPDEPAPVKAMREAIEAPIAPGM